MEKIDPVRALLSTIAEAVRVFQKNQNVPRGWMVEAEFCSRLRATLESVRDCSPIKGNLPHAQELNHLIQVVLQQLSYFYRDLAPGLSNLQKGCAPGASPAVLSQVEGQLGGLVIPRTKLLHEQVSRYMQGIDTLLLLYIMYASSVNHDWASVNSHDSNSLASQPNVLLSEKRLRDLHNIARRAQIGALQGLDQLTKQFTANSLKIDEQQRCLTGMRRDVENHWASQQASAKRVSNDAAKPGKKTAEVQARPPEQGQGTNSRHSQPAMRPATQSPAPQPRPPVQAAAHPPKSSTPKLSGPKPPHAGAYPGPGVQTTTVVNVGVHAAAHSAASTSQPAQPRPYAVPGSGAAPPSMMNPGPKRKQVASSSGPPPAALTPGGKQKPAAPAGYQPPPQNQQGPVSQPGRTSKPPQKAAPLGKQNPGHNQAQHQSSSHSGGGHRQNPGDGSVTYVMNNTHHHTSNQSINQSISQQSLNQYTDNQYSNDQYSNNQYSNNQYMNNQYSNDQYMNNQYSNTDCHIRPESPAFGSGRSSSDPGNAHRQSGSDSDHRPNQPEADYDPPWSSQDPGAYQTPGSGIYPNHHRHDEPDYRGPEAYEGPRDHPGQPEPSAYALQDMGPGARPPSPLPPTYPGPRDGGGGGGYPQQAPMRASADSARSRSKTGGYVAAAAAAGGAAIGVGAAVAAAGGSGEEEDEGCCGCGGDGCCEGGCCEGGCCEGGCCGGGGGCCGDDDGTDDGCCVIM